MTRKDYRDILAERFLEQNNSIIEFTRQIKDSLICLNDNSLLHANLLSEHKEILRTEVETNKKNMRNFWILVGVLVAAVIILAGAEKALKFLPFL